MSHRPPPRPKQVFLAAVIVSAIIIYNCSVFLSNLADEFNRIKEASLLDAPPIVRNGASYTQRH